MYVISKTILLLTAKNYQITCILMQT